MTEPERIARLYEGFYAEHESSDPLPRFVGRESVGDGPEFVSPLCFIAGWVVVLAVFGLIWIGV